MSSLFRWFVGLDWGSKTHHACILDADGEVLAQHSFPHGGAGQDELARWLRHQTGAPPDQIGVAIETPRGPVVEGLLLDGFPVHSIGPVRIRESRQRYAPSGAKDDSRDAHMLARALRSDPQIFRVLQLEHPLVPQLRQLTRTANRLTEERTRFGNRIRELLWSYFPQLLDLPGLSGQITRPWFIALWHKAPVPDKARRIRLSTLSRFLKDHRVRCVSADRLLENFRAPALRVAPGTTEAACAAITVAFDQVKPLNRLLTQTKKNIQVLLDELSRSTPAGSRPHDIAILLSIPGAGRYVVGTLFAEAYDLICGRDLSALRALSGVAPIHVQSGSSHWTQRRLTAQSELREALFHWARVAADRDPHWNARYKALRAKGHRRGRALRTIGDRLLSVACAMLRDGTLYDPSRFPETTAA